MKITKEEGLIYFYYSNDIENAKIYIDNKINCIEERYNNNYIHEALDDFRKLYAEVRSMLFYIAEKSNKTKYDYDFYNSIDDTNMELKAEDITYIENKLFNGENKKYVRIENQ